MSECTKLEREYLDLILSGCTDRKKVLTALHKVELAGVDPDWKEKTIQVLVRRLQAEREWNKQWKLCTVKGDGDFSAFSTLWEEIQKTAEERVEEPNTAPVSYWYGNR